MLTNSVEHLDADGKSGSATSRFRSWWFGALVAFLVFSNVATLFNDGVHRAAFNVLSSVLGALLPEAALSRVLSRSPTQNFIKLSKSNAELTTRHMELKQISTKRAEVVSQVSNRVARRAIVNAGKNISSVAVEALPFVGATTMLALTASDIYDDCQMLKDMNELNTTFGQAMHEEATVCSLKVPGFKGGSK